MARIGFAGVGNMGGPMAGNLVAAGHELVVFDVSDECLERAVGLGARAARSAAEAADGAEAFVSMLPAGEQVRAVYDDALLEAAAEGALLIDCSTIDVETSRAVHALGAERGFATLDAPVSGGVAGAAAGTLTFMVGGARDAFERAAPLLDAMGAKAVHCGGPGSGQAVKACNNMMLGTQMAVVAEAFALAERLGLDARTLYEVSSRASGQCWALTSYCPVPGLVESAPSNDGYRPGFATAMMVKDMGLALEAAERTGARVDVARRAAALYAERVEAGGGGADFSAIIETVRGTAAEPAQPDASAASARATNVSGS